MQGHFDNIKLQRGLVTFLFVVATVAIASYGIKASKAVIYWLVVIFPVAVYFVKDPRALVIFGIMAQLAWLVTPGFQQHVTSPFNLASFALFASSSAMIAMRKLSPSKTDASVRWLIAFLAVMVLTMAVRGSGLAMLGSTSWGGGRYILLTLLFLFYISLRRFEYNRVHVRWLIWGGIGATGMLACGQWLFLHSGGHTFGLTNFMQIQAESVAGSELTGDVTAMSRFTQLRWLAYAVLPLAFFWPKRRVLSWFIILGSVFMMFMTGFRNEVVSLGIVYLACGLALSKERGLFLVGHGIVAGLGYIALILISPHLPETATRAISFLPGIHTSALVEKVSERSVTWRFEVWAYCLKAVPAHLLVGRGLAFNVLEWAWLPAYVYATPEFFYGTHAYHSGPLALLLDFGIAGFITMTGFFLTTSIYAIREIRKIRKRDTIYYKFAMYMVVLYVWSVVKFYLIYGDLGDFVSRMVTIYSMLYITIDYLRSKMTEDALIETIPNPTE